METRRWLLDRLTEGNVRGLKWTHKKRKQFRVPAKHLGRRDVNTSDKALYEAWAKHTKRHGCMKLKPSKKKAQFREQLKMCCEKNLIRETCRVIDSEDPFIIYEFLDKITEDGGDKPQTASPKVEKPLIPTTVEKVSDDDDDDDDDDIDDDIGAAADDDDDEEKEVERASGFSIDLSFVKRQGALNGHRFDVARFGGTFPHADIGQRNVMHMPMPPPAHRHSPHPTFMAAWVVPKEFAQNFHHHHHRQHQGTAPAQLQQPTRSMVDGIGVADDRGNAARNNHYDSLLTNTALRHGASLITPAYLSASPEDDSGSCTPRILPRAATTPHDATLNISTN